MYNRQILSELDDWSKSAFRKVLILRGARQVGKTTAVRMFAESFDTYIELNLELQDDLQVFETFTTVQRLYNLILLKKQVAHSKDRVLLFIDEIQYSANAMRSLRYFHEEMPELYVIAAGSLLEIYLYREKLEISVGRVEYRWMYPMNFEEYLLANGDQGLLKLIMERPFPSYALPVLRERFVQYALVGGMPEAVKVWLTTKDISQVRNCFDSLLHAYQDDILKYAHSTDQAIVIRHIFDTSFSEMGKQITYEGFGGSAFKSQAVKSAFQLLERASFITLLYPYTSSILPAVPQLRRRPKLIMLDTGLLNHQARVMEDYFTQPNLHSIYKGIAMEHLVGQLLSSVKAQNRFDLSFWVRDARGSTAEIDYVLIYRGKMIPIEVKAGKTGSLKSLMLFMDSVDHDLAVRIYDGEVGWEQITSPAGKPFRLLNLHLGLTARVCDYLNDVLNVLSTGMDQGAQET